LKEIFPLQKVDDEYKFCNFTLPNVEELNLVGESSFLKGSKDPYPKHDKEEIAAGLGCLAQLLYMVSKYLEVTKTLLFLKK
jgi:hypothetical protein